MSAGDARDKAGAAARQDRSQVAAVLLAAGESSRMRGINKLALEIDGVALIRRTLGTIAEAGVGEIVVVLGHEADRIAPIVAQRAGQSTLRCVRHAAYSQGQQGSVLAGLAALAAGEGDSATTRTGPVMVVLGDLPLLEARDLVALLDAFEARNEGVEAMQPWFENRRGNPVVVTRRVVDAVLALGDTRAGLRGWIDAHPDSVARFEALNDHYTFDLDSREDIERLEQRLGHPLEGWRTPD